ncbi:MAG TPA: hypothetical protein VM581_03525 [Magnetospirillaceae bacterium]|nr:hypothetical protein [Magnetospirillaceae bacterium]
MGSPDVVTLTAEEFAVFAVNRQPMFVPEIGDVRIDGFSISNDGRYVTVHGRLVDGGTLKNFVGFTVDQTTGELTVDVRYPGTARKKVKQVQSATYTGPNWSTWCSAMQTGMFLSIHPAGVPSQVVLVQTDVLGRRGQYRATLRDLNAQVFEATLHGRNGLVLDVRLPRHAQTSRPAVHSPQVPQGVYLLPRRPAGMNMRQPHLFQALQPKTSGPALYLAPLVSSPTQNPGVVWFVDPFGDRHHAEVIGERGGRYDVPVKFVV